MNIIEFDNGAFKDEKYGTIKYGLTNLTKNSILQQCCDKLSYIKGIQPKAIKRKCMVPLWDCWTHFLDIVSKIWVHT